MLDGFSLDNVSDPTDFLPTAPSLKLLDEALRCSICKDYFEAPMTVNCPSGHCFCSACIREFLLHRPNPTCPQCASPISEGQLRKNQTVEDTVRSWSTARSLVLDLVRQQALEREMTPMRESSTSRATSATIDTPKKKRKPSGSSDEDIIQIITPKKLKSRSATALKFQERKQDDDPMVTCPICGKDMPNSLMFDHIGRKCASPTPSDLARVTHASSSKDRQKEQWGRVFSEGSGSGSGSKGKGKGKAKATTPLSDEDAFNDPLPKVAYDTQSLKRIKQLLRDQGLSDTGDKPALVARHEHWVIIFNANRDASPAHRKTVRQLRAELERWERTIGDDRGGKKRSQAVDTVAHQEIHKAMFKQLTEAARRTAGGAGRKAVDGPSMPVRDGEPSMLDNQESQEGTEDSEAPPLPGSPPDAVSHERTDGDRNRDDEGDIVLVDR